MSEPTPKDVAELTDDPITKGERETFEARLEELLEENRALKVELAQARNLPPPDPAPLNPAQKTWQQSLEEWLP
jgi:hypothetical protein